MIFAFYLVLNIVTKEILSNARGVLVVGAPSQIYLRHIHTVMA
jgi:hypothetical protein